MIRGLNEAMQQYSLKSKGGSSKLSNFKANKSDVLQMLTTISSYQINSQIEQGRQEIDVGQYIDAWNKESRQNDETKSFLSHQNYPAYMIEAFSLAQNNQMYQLHPQSIPSQKIVTPPSYIEKRWSNNNSIGQDNRHYRNDYKPYYQAEPQKDYRNNSYRYNNNDYYRNVQKKPNDYYPHNFNQN